MNISLFIAFYLVTCLSKEVFADNEINANEIKKGAFPYMAYLFYSDESVKENGQRFLHGAVLLRPQWLMSSAIDPVLINNEVKGFPKQSMYARIGATTIDDEFDLDEEEGEQEREILLLVRPARHNFVFWWITDISLAKTVSPFNLTEDGLPRLNFKRDVIDKKCFILIFAKKYGNVTEDRVLMKLAIEFLPPSTKNCGPLFNESTMACGVDVDEGEPTFDTTFCQSNRGSPLICEKDVTGVQTYIESDNQCKQPYLYQLMSPWKEFINCAIYNNLQNASCKQTCIVINKNSPHTEYEAYLVNSDLEAAAAENAPVVTASPITVTTTSPSTEKAVKPQESESEKSETPEPQTINYDLRLEEKNAVSSARSVPLLLPSSPKPPLGAPYTIGNDPKIHEKGYGRKDCPSNHSHHKKKSGATSVWHSYTNFLLGLLVSTCLM